MALKPCRECKKKVSTEATVCPSCGVPNPTQSTKNKKRIISKKQTKPWGEENSNTQKVDSGELNPNNYYAQCEQSFCSNRYKIVINPMFEKQICRLCGNILKKVDQKDAEKKYIEDQKYSSSNYENPQRSETDTVKKVQQNLVEKIWWGNETLGTIFWMYCILTVAVVSFISGLGLEAVGGIVLVIPGIVIIWSNTGLWRSSDKFKSAQLRINQSYGWATAAKVYVVINYIVTISQLGLQLQTMQPL